MIGEIQRMGGRNIVISTNVQTKRDGTPYAKDIGRIPDDAGVAVYFERKGSRVCFCCDLYQKIWENMRAIGKTIEAMRGIERWGSAEMLDRAFTGFAALPAPEGHNQPHWTHVLGLDRHSTPQMIELRYRTLAKKQHPDHGGSDEAMARLNKARREGLESAGA